MRGFLKGSVCWMKFSVFLVVLLLFFFCKKMIYSSISLYFLECLPSARSPFFPPSFVEIVAEKGFQSTRREWMNLGRGSHVVHSLSSQSQPNVNDQEYKWKSYCKPEVSQIAHYYTKYALFWVQGVCFHRGVCEAVRQNWGKIRTNIWCCGRSGSQRYLPAS